MKIDIRKLTIQILALIGLALSIKLAMIYYVANYEKYALASFCSINEFIDCDGVARTVFSQFLGIPLAYWGMFLYVTILFLTFVDKIKNYKIFKIFEVFKEPMAYITFLGTFAFIISMGLAGISIYLIKKICILCVVTYIIDLLIAIVSAKNWKEYFINFKTTFFDFISGVKKYPKTFAAFLLIAIAFLSYSAIANPFLPNVRKSKEIKKYITMTENPYRADGNVLGAENADVVIELYSDFVCPMCYINNIMLHRAVKEYSNIKVIHHNFPFDKECNLNISINMHPGACYMAKAALAAKNQGNYWGMSSLLYEKKPMNDQDMEVLVDELGFNKKKFFKDMNSKEISNNIQQELDKAAEMNLDSTPTMFINGEKNVGIMPYEDMKKLLEKHGAKKRT